MAHRWRHMVCIYMGKGPTARMARHGAARGQRVMLKMQLHAICRCQAVQTAAKRRSVRGGSLQAAHKAVKRRSDTLGGC